MPPKRPSGSKTKCKSAPRARKPVREVDGIFFDREHLDRALTALHAAGFSKGSMTAALERHEGGRRIAVTEIYHPPASRTLTSVSSVRSRRV